jgi:hypothetical protein
VNLGALARPAIDGQRFLIVSYLPTYAAAVLLMALVWAGVPGPLHADRIWRTASGLGIGELVLIALAITLLAVLLHPLQLPLVRLLEGGWPRPLAPLARWSRDRQVAHRGRLATLEQLPDGPLTEARIQAAGQAGTRLRQRYPVAALCRPTALGNVLAAVETRAGDAYGYDAVVAWPRLYPLLPEQTRSIVDDRRNTLDTAARLCVTMAATAAAATALLAASGWWLLLAAIPLLVSWTAYHGAVQAGVAYGEAVETAFDLHRFALTTALHLPLPADDTAERETNLRLSDFWRQGVRTPTAYHHDTGETT